MANTNTSPPAMTRASRCRLAAGLSLALIFCDAFKLLQVADLAAATGPHLAGWQQQPSAAAAAALLANEPAAGRQPANKEQPFGE